MYGRCAMNGCSNELKPGERKICSGHTNDERLTYHCQVIWDDMPEKDKQQLAKQRLKASRKQPAESPPPEAEQKGSA